MKKLTLTIVLGTALLIGATTQVNAEELIKIEKNDPGIMQPMSGGSKPPVIERP